jgi:glycine cleavage system regulatory protein
MCRLGGEFAGILRIEIESTAETSLRRDLEGLHAQGLNVVIAATQTVPDDAQRRMAKLELVGQDRPGIVREISHALARQGINVEELATECTSAPMSGENLFRASARLHLPESCPVETLRKELERIGGNLLVDVSIEELQPGTV